MRAIHELKSQSTAVPSFYPNFFLFLPSLCPLAAFISHVHSTMIWENRETSALAHGISGLLKALWVPITDLKTVSLKPIVTFDTEQLGKEIVWIKQHFLQILCSWLVCSCFLEHSLEYLGQEVRPEPYLQSRNLPKICISYNLISFLRCQKQNRITLPQTCRESIHGHQLIRMISETVQNNFIS